jgi:hypothetical protein
MAPPANPDEGAARPDEILEDAPHELPDGQSLDRLNPNPYSSFSLSISLTVGYQRRRAFAGRFESSVTSLVLLAGGVLLTFLVVIGLLHVLGVVF